MKSTSNERTEHRIFVARCVLWEAWISAFTALPSTKKDGHFVLPYDNLKFRILEREILSVGSVLLYN